MFTYFDTAWMYCGFKSEDAAGEALVSRHNMVTTGKSCICIDGDIGIVIDELRK